MNLLSPLSTSAVANSQDIHWFGKLAHTSATSRVAASYPCLRQS